MQRRVKLTKLISIFDALTLSCVNQETGIFYETGFNEQ